MQDDIILVMRGPYLNESFALCSILKGEVIYHQGPL